MKKIIFTAVSLIVISGVLPSCTKQAGIKPVARVEYSTSAARKDIGTAD
ncbi:hypothetical protein [Mucilaginibacter sp. MD40]|nr:hypothetical protein [Mucilaginibacter sp. MD40]